VGADVLHLGVPNLLGTLIERQGTTVAPVFNHNAGPANVGMKKPATRDGFLALFVHRRIMPGKLILNVTA
jgi:hypothetical protein